MVNDNKKLVGFLDVLGFSELVKRSDFSAYFSKYTQIIKECVKVVHNQSIDYVVFSDTIVIVSQETKSYTDLRDIIEIVSLFSYRALTELGLPIKGCVSYGRVTYDRDEKDIVIAGPAIVEAYHFEQKQDWVGLMLSPNLVREFNLLPQHLVYRMSFNGQEKIDCLKDNFTFNASVQRTTSIAFKDGKCFEGFAITPHHKSSYTAEHLIEDLEHYGPVRKKWSVSPELIMLTTGENNEPQTYPRI